MDAIIGLFGQVLWPILLGLGALAAAWGYGVKKRREGQAAERERAKAAREAAAKEATAIRKETATKTTDQQRRDVERWEK